jgi:hypothetical protein
MWHGLLPGAEEVFSSLHAKHAKSPLSVGPSS